MLSELVVHDQVRRVIPELLGEWIERAQCLAERAVKRLIAEAAAAGIDDHAMRPGERLVYRKIHRHVGARMRLRGRPEADGEKRLTRAHERRGRRIRQVERVAVEHGWGLFDDRR